MANRIAVLVALEGADEGLKRTLDAAERSMGDFASTARSASDKAAAGMGEVKAGMSALDEQIGKAKTQLLAFLTVAWAASKAKEAIEVADAYGQMAERIRMATRDQEEYAQVQQRLRDTANITYRALGEQQEMYIQTADALRSLGYRTDEVLDITDSFSYLLTTNAASAQRAQSAMDAYTKSIQSGKVSAQSWQTLMAATPTLVDAIAGATGKTSAEIRQLGVTGKLAISDLNNGLYQTVDANRAATNGMVTTFGDAMTRLSNEWSVYIGEANRATQATQKIVALIDALAANFDTVMAWLKRLIEVGLMVLIYRLIPALITAWQTAGAAAVAAARTTTAAWATANLSLGNAIATVGKLRVAFAVLSAALIGWEIGTWLSEKFTFVRKAGIFMVEVLMRGIEQLRFGWEVFAAIFTSDTIAEATARHAQRLAEMNRIFAEMYADASDGAEAARGAMDSAASAAEEVAKRLSAVRRSTQEALAAGIEAIHATLEQLASRLGEVEQAVGRAQATVNDATGKMAEAYRVLTGQIEAALAQQVLAVKNRYEQEKAELERSGQSERARITQSTALLTEALSQQTTLRRQATTDTLQLIEQESQARREAAARQGESDSERALSVQRVENDILATKRQTLTQALAEYRQHVDALNAEANRHLAEVQRIEQAKRQLSMSTEERIRDIRRQAMSDFEATEDRKRQIAELQQQARTALANGELELARARAQKAMDLAAQVASAQTSEAKRAEDARRQSEQALSQAVQLEGQAREASRRKEYGQEADLLRQAGELRAQAAQRAREADEQSTRGKAGVRQAIDDIRQSEDILNRSLDAEAQAHRTAADTATRAREDIGRVLRQTQSQIDEISAKLQEGLKLTLDADTSRFEQALAELDRTLEEKRVLLTIQADLKEAEQTLKDYEVALKEGRTLPIDADVSKAQQALDKLKTYAEQSGQFDLKVSTEQAQAAIGQVDGMIRSLDRIQTESRHQVDSNAAAARAEVMSLDGAHTSSTHTIYVQRVEVNASGGLAGGGIRRFAQGGRAAAPASPISAAFPRLSGGTIPGSGHHDSVPRTLDAGAFVLRKAAVRKYGAARLANLARGVARFATGGPVERAEDRPSGPKRNRDVVEALKLVDLGYQGMMTYVSWLTTHRGLALSGDFRFNTERNYGRQAGVDREYLGKLVATKTPTSTERSIIEVIKGRWRSAMSQALLVGKDLERELIDYMEAHQGEFFRGGGLAKSDTVPAMLTPGEFVVNRSTVARLGAGFFEALNNLSAPAHALAGRTMTRVQGYANGGLVRPPGSSLPRPAWPEPSTPSRTVRVELAAGGQRVNATIDAGDEARLLQMLSAARARAM